MEALVAAYARGQGVRSGCFCPQRGSEGLLFHNGRTPHRVPCLMGETHLFMDEMVRSDYCLAHSQVVYLSPRRVAESRLVVLLSASRVFLLLR